MEEKNRYNDIEQALDANNLDAVWEKLEEARQSDGETATYFYLLGKAHMKKSEWGKAMSGFLKAEELNPDSPARECRLMLNDIMAFYNKDMYNQ